VKCVAVGAEGVTLDSSEEKYFFVCAHLILEFELRTNLRGAQRRAASSPPDSQPDLISSLASALTVDRVAPSRRQKPRRYAEATEC